MEDASDVGHDATHPEAVDKYDAKAGKYKDVITPLPTDDKLATAQMPKGTDPSPFTLGPLSSGGR